MKNKRIMVLALACMMCVSVFSVHGQELVSQETVIGAEAADFERVDYSDPANWAYWNDGGEKRADLFIICPTVDMGKSGDFNADITGDKYRESFVGALNMELGIYENEANIYAPYYRQATFPVYSMDDEKQEKYLGIAYEDVKDAFLYYVKKADPAKPLIVAGFSQGSDMAVCLMKELFDDPSLARRLVATYCIGWKLTEDDVKKYPHLAPASGENDTGVIVSFNTEAEDITTSVILGENEKTFSINPLNWKTTSEKADKSENLGACFTDYSGSITKEIKNLTGAYIDEKRGVLKVTDIEKSDYPGNLFEDGVYHLYDYQFFYRNLQENVSARLDAFTDKYKDRVTVVYEDEVIVSDVEPVIEDGRTLIPFRAIFEIMGCAVDYTEENGQKTVTAHRGNDSLLLNIGDSRMYFNSKEIPLDVPAKIVSDRTLVPLRAVSEAFECEVFWDDSSKKASVCPPAGFFDVGAEKLEKTISDADGTVLVEAVAYYPNVENPDNIPVIDTINEEYKFEAELFIKKATESAENAKFLYEQMGADKFKPFEYALTFEDVYNIYGNISITNYEYVNLGGVHPDTKMSSRTFSSGVYEEYSVSNILDEEVIGGSLRDYLYNLFAKKLAGLDIKPDEDGRYSVIDDELGSCNFYLTGDSLVIYFNQGQVAPYALGVISIEIPYEPTIFNVTLDKSGETSYVCEVEYDRGYEWKILRYSEDKLVVTAKTEEYDPAKLLSEYYPIGMTTISAEGIKKGNAFLTIAEVEKGGDVSTATRVIDAVLYINDDFTITVVDEGDTLELLDYKIK